MKSCNRKEMVSILFAIILVFGSAQTVLAAGTASGTSISNTVTVDYESGAGPISTNDTTNFVVDTKVDLTITWDDGSAVTVGAGDTGVALRFTVANVGNDTQDFAVSAEDVVGRTVGAITDNFDATNANVYLDEGDGVFGVGDTLITYIDNLAADANAIVFIVADIPAVQLTDDYAVFDLRAVAFAAGGVGSQGGAIADDATADNPATVQIVFADGSGSNDSPLDGNYTTDGIFHVTGTAILGVVKSSLVISDPFNGGANPKAIPGAIVTYTITISNTGNAAASSVSLADTLQSETVYETGTMLLDGVGVADGVAYAGGPPEVLSVSVPNISAGGSAVFTFNVEIQ
jgi:uncharacterized repeat protein (TIGR01451 family)